VNNSRGKTASQLLFGFTPRSGTDVVIRDEVLQIPSVIDDLLTARQEAAGQIEAAQQKQKKSFDQKRKAARKYKEGDLVMIEENPTATGTSRKLQRPFSGPMVTKKVLPNDRYVITDMGDFHRTSRKSSYNRVIASGGWSGAADTTVPTQKFI
jgi:hypothetical protein